MPETELDAMVRRSRATGQDLGIRSAGGHQRWAYLMTATEGRAADDPQVRGFIRDGEGTPDAQVKVAMKDLVATLRQASAGASS